MCVLYRPESIAFSGGQDPFDRRNGIRRCHINNKAALAKSLNTNFGSYKVLQSRPYEAFVKRNAVI